MNNCQVTQSPIGSAKWKTEPACECAACSIFQKRVRLVGWTNALSEYMREPRTAAGSLD